MSAPAITAAVARLQAGALVAFPTETVYGLGADATNPRAIAAIFARKGRPHDHPVIVHIAESAELAVWAREIPAAAHLLTQAFWPGPLTLILRRTPRVLNEITGRQDTVGVRCPAHPLALQLLRAAAAAGMPGLAAPSANRYGQVSPTTAAHVREEFGPTLLVLDGGACEVGIESTIVDVSGAAPRILRPGMISAAAITAVLQRPLSAERADAPRVSGALAAHYAPRTPLQLVPTRELAAAISAANVRAATVVLVTYSSSLSHAGQTLILPATPAAYAHEIYAALRAADALGVDLILVEAPPADDAWSALEDRLRRAAHGARGDRDPLSRVEVARHTV